MSVIFELRENIPVFKPKRNVPFTALNKINKELNCLENMGVISKVEYSNWAPPIVYVKKPSKEICVCADFSMILLKLIITLFLVFKKFLQGSIMEIFFSKLDLSNMYLQILVDDECLKLLTINTPKELYRFNRLPFRIKFSPGIFQ